MIYFGGDYLNGQWNAGCMLNQLEKARHFCEEKGARFTHLREKVYALLLEEQGAVGAYELLDTLKLTEANAKPAK